MRTKLVTWGRIACLGLLFLILVVVLVIRFYPYSYQYSAFPKETRTKSKVEGDPINLVFIGSQQQITQTFQHAGWLIPDPTTTETSKKIAIDSLAHRSYPKAPVSNLYVFGRIQDMALEKPTNDVREREHFRMWKTGTFVGGQPIWIGQASYDSGIELSKKNDLPTHHIASTVDLERNRVEEDLQKSGIHLEKAYTAFTTPIFIAHNGGGDFYESDGNILEINFTSVPVDLKASSGVMEQLKVVFFLFYDTLLTTPILLGIVEILVLLLVVVGSWPILKRIYQSQTLQKIIYSIVKSDRFTKKQK